MRKHSSLSVLDSVESNETYTLDDEDDDLPPSLQDPPKSSTSRRQDIYRQENKKAIIDEDDSSLQDSNPSIQPSQRQSFYHQENKSNNEFRFSAPSPSTASRNTWGDNSQLYKPPPAPSTSSGYSSGRTSGTATSIITRQYYSGHRNTPQASPDDSNANLQRYSSQGFGVTAQDWKKGDSELIKTLNASNNNNAMIAYPAKLIKTPKSKVKVAPSESRPDQQGPLPPPPSVSSMKRAAAAVATEPTLPKSPPKKTKAVPSSASHAPSEKSTGKPVSVASVRSSQLKSKPKKNKAVTASPSASLKSGKSGKSVKSPPTTGENGEDKKSKKSKAKAGKSKSKHQTPVETDEEDEPPPAPPEYADKGPTKSKRKTSQSSHKSTGPLIEDDRTAGKRVVELPDSGREAYSGAVEEEVELEKQMSNASVTMKESLEGSNHSKVPSEVPLSVAEARSAAPSSTKYSKSSQVSSPPPSPPPPFKDVEQKTPPESLKGSGRSCQSGGGTVIPRTPPETAVNSEHSKPPPPPSHPPESTSKIEQEESPQGKQEEQQGDQEHTLTLPICNCNNAKLVQAKLIECFPTQPKSQCSCQCQQQGSCCRGGRIPVYDSGGSGCCARCKPAVACFTPCSCQRCRVYHYCFNVLNRHTLKPEDMFLGISQYEQNELNRLRRQSKLNPPYGCATNHIITNSSEGEAASTGAQSDKSKMESGNHSGAKNWPSPPEGYQEGTNQQEVSGDAGCQDNKRLSNGSGGHCRESSGMINPWQTEYSAQFKDFSDQIRRSSSRYPSYDEGYGGKFGGCCCGGGGQQGKQMRQGNCFDESRNRSAGFCGSYVQIPEEARRIHLLSKLHSCNNNNLDFKCNYIPSNQYCSWMKLRMAVRALRCCEMKRGLGCCQKPEGICGVGGRRRLARNVIRKRNEKSGGRSKSSGKSQQAGGGYDDGYNMRTDFGDVVGGRVDRGGPAGGYGTSKSLGGAGGGYSDVPGVAGGSGFNNASMGGSGFSNASGVVGVSGYNNGPALSAGPGFSNSGGFGGGSGFSNSGGFGGGSRFSNSGGFGGGSGFSNSGGFGGGSGFSNAPGGGLGFNNAAGGPGFNTVLGFNDGSGNTTAPVMSAGPGFSNAPGFSVRSGVSNTLGNPGISGGTAYTLNGPPVSDGPGFSNIPGVVAGLGEDDPSRFKTLERVPKQSSDLYGNVGGGGSRNFDEESPTGFGSSGPNAPFFGGTSSGFTDLEDPSRLKTLENVPRQTGDFYGGGGSSRNNNAEDIPIFGMIGAGSSSTGFTFDDTGRLKTLERVPKQSSDFNGLSGFNLNNNVDNISAFGMGGAAGGAGTPESTFDDFDDSSRLKVLERVPRQNNNFEGDIGRGRNNNNEDAPSFGMGGDMLGGSGGQFNDDPRQFKALERVPRQNGDFYGGGFSGRKAADDNVFKASLDPPTSGLSLKPLEKVPRQTLEIPKKVKKADRDPDELFNYYKQKADEWRKDHPDDEYPPKPKPKPKPAPKKSDASSDSFVLVKTIRTVRKSMKEDLEDYDDEQEQVEGGEAQPTT